MVKRTNPLDTIEQTFGGDPYGLAGQTVYDNHRGTWTDALTGKTSRATQPFGVGLADQLEHIAKANDAASRQAMQAAATTANAAAREAQQSHTTALRALDSLTQGYEKQINAELRRREQEAAAIRREQERQQREAAKREAVEKKAIEKAKSVRDLPADMLNKIPKFDPTKIQGWDKLTHPDRQRLYDEYSKAVTEGVKSINPNFDDIDVSSFVAELNKDTMPRMQKRTWGEAFSDWANLSAAAVDKIQQSAWYDLIDPSSAEAKANRAERQSHLNQLSYQTRSELRENELRSQAAKAAGETGFWAWLKNVKNSPAAVLSQDGAEAAAGIGIAGAGAIGTYLSGGTAAAATAPLIGTGASMLYGAASSAGGMRGDIYERIHAADDAYLQANSADYRELRKTMSENLAKDALGSRVIDHLPELITAASAGAVLERFGLGKLGTSKAVGAAAERGFKAAAGRVGREAVSEGAEEAVQQAAANYGFRRYDPNQALTEDVLLAAGMGATLGGGAAGVLNAGTSIANRGRPAVNSEEAAQQSVIGDIGFAEESAGGDNAGISPTAAVETTVVENSDGTYTMLTRTPDGGWQYDPRLGEDINPRSPEADRLVNPTAATEPQAESQAEPQAEPQTEIEEVATPDSDVATTTEEATQTSTATQTEAEAQAAPAAALEAAAQVAETFDPNIETAVAGFARMQPITNESSVSDSLRNMRSAQAILSSLTPAERTFISNSRQVESVSPELAFAVREAGIESRMVAGNAWADALLSGEVSSPLEAIISNYASAGVANADIAGALQTAFSLSGVPMPQVNLNANLPNGTRGSYRLGTHTVNFRGGRTTANTVVHEYMHALTMPGLSALQQLSLSRNVDNPDVAEAKQFIKTVESLHKFLKNKAGNDTYYGNANVAEMFAELVRPEFMMLANQYTVGDLIESGFADSDTATYIMNQSGSSKFSALTNLIKFIAKTAVNAASRLVGIQANPHGNADLHIDEAISRMAAVAARIGGRQNFASPASETQTAAPNSGAATPAIGESAEDADTREMLSANANTNYLGIAPVHSAMSRTITQLGKALSDAGLRLHRSFDPSGLSEWDGANRRVVDDSAPFNGRRVKFLNMTAQALERIKAQYENVTELTLTPVGSFAAKIEFETADGSAGTISIHFLEVRNVRQMKWNTMSFAIAPQGMGGMVYDAVNGALVASGIRPYNDQLTARNAARLPINRLRAALKWGNYFHKPGTSTPIGAGKAAAGLRLGGRSSIPHGRFHNADPASQGNYLANLTSVVVNQAEREGVLRGVNVMNPDGSVRLASGQVVSTEKFDELIAPAYSANPAYISNAGRAGQATAYAKKFAAIVRGLEAVRGNERATRELIRHVVDSETSLFQQDNNGGYVPDGLDSLLPFQVEDDAETGEVYKDNGDDAATNAVQPPAPSATGDSVTDPLPMVDDEIPEAPSQRDAVEFIGDVEAGRSVASSYWRTNLQNAVQDGNVKSAAGKLVKDLVSKADEVFADSIRPFRNWLNSMADSSVIGERDVNKIMGSLYRAASYRDALLRRMREEWGLEQVEEALSEISAKSKISRSTAIEWAGMWLSAVYAPEATMHILNRNARENKARQSRAQDLQSRLDGMEHGTSEYTETETELRQLQRDIADVAEDMRLMLQAANEPVVRRKTPHAVGGGMNFATAARIREVIESKIDPKLLKSLHEPMRKMMAYRLAMDVESGKTSVAKMVEFTGKPELRELGNALAAAAAAADSRVDGSMQRLDAARDALAAAAESNYVPLTGNPEHAMSVEMFGMDNFGQQSRAPNGGRNFRMEGRRELPDSAIKAAMSAAISSATYAGYKSFGDQIAALHRKLTPEQRDRFGLHAAAMSEDQSYPANSIIVRRNGRITAYHMSDATAFEALRKGNLDMQRNQLGEMIGGVTRKMAWLMTQGNPYFIARQIVQDGWERGTTLMGKELYDASGNKIDSVAVARHMRNMLLNPFQLAKMANAALSVAFQRNKLMRRVFDADPYTAQMIKELINEGGISTRASMFAYSSADMERSMQRNRKAALPIVKNAIVDFAESLNNAVEYTTSLAAYTAMREHGMSKTDAINTQLDLSNFRKKGAANAAFAPLWAFAQPAFMGGSNLISSAFDRQGRPKAKTMKYLATRTAILLALQSIIRSIAEDDEGGDQIDQMNPYTLASRLPIPLGDGKTFDIPLGFGLARVANAAARGMLGIGSGDKSVKEAAIGIISDGIIAGVSPIQPSEINPQKRPTEWALATFVPTIFKPILETAINRNSFDGRIVNNANAKKDEFNWQQFGGNTSQFWREISKALHDATGIDLAPEQTRHLIRGYLPGLPANLMREFVDRPYAESIGRDPGNSLFVPLNLLNTEAAINGQFNKITEDIEDLIKVRSADPAAFAPDSEQYQLIQAYESWKKRNNALSGKMKSITQSPLSKEAKERARTQIRLQRTEEGRRMLAEYRRIKGLDYQLTK